MIHSLGNPCALDSVFWLLKIIKVLQKSVPEISVHGATTGLKDIYIRCGRVVTDFDWEAKNRFNF